MASKRSPCPAFFKSINIRFPSEINANRRNGIKLAAPIKIDRAAKTEASGPPTFKKRMKNPTRKFASGPPRMNTIALDRRFLLLPGIILIEPDAPVFDSDLKEIRNGGLIRNGPKRTQVN
jgi:hypothetical protein